jgi:hypothetical protein
MLRAPATVTGAVYQQAADAVLTDDLRPVRNAGNSTAVRTPAKPAFCQLTGTIAPVTAGAQPIGFQVNLPTAWNGSSVQFGAAGSTACSSTAPATSASTPTPAPCVPRCCVAI